MKVEGKPEESVLVAETSEVTVSKKESKTNEAVRCSLAVRVIDFSFFNEISLLASCHQEGDNWVPP